MNMQGQDPTVGAYGDAVVEQPMDAMGQTAAQSPMIVETIRLRRSGQRPLLFRGTVLANIMSFRVGTPFWYELNVFRIEGAGFAGDIRLFFKSEDEQDQFQVVVGQSIEEIVTFFESHDAGNDMTVDFDFSDAKASMSELAFKALALRARVESARQQYRGLVSEIISRIDQHQPTAEMV